MAPHSAADSHQGKATKGKSPCQDTASKPISTPAPTASGYAPPPPRRVPDLHPTPIIRVIHIYAPKVIQTDVASFKATVQKLTGKSKRRSKRSKRAPRIATPPVEHPDPAPVAAPPPALMTDSANIAQGAIAGSFSAVGASSGAAAAVLGQAFESARELWEQEEAHELQGLISGDGCGACHADLDLVRCHSSGDSATYSLDTYSGSNASSSCNLRDHIVSPSTQMHPSSFSFGTAFPQRESPFCLSEIPAPFFAADTVTHPCSYNHGALGAYGAHGAPAGAQSGALQAELEGMLQMPGPAFGMTMVPDPSSSFNSTSRGTMLGFDVEIGGLCSPLMADLPPFPRPSPGGLFDMVQPQQHCRLSVLHQQLFQGAFFESSS